MLSKKRQSTISSELVVVGYYIQKCGRSLGDNLGKKSEINVSKTTNQSSYKLVYKPWNNPHEYHSYIYNKP